jgi:ADP-L-glycero-D-manno-heptose 6-epimerase
MPERGCYIVTGGAGFLGSNVAAALVKQDAGADVVVVDDLRGGSFLNLVDAFERASLPPFGGRFIAKPLEELDPAQLLATRGLRAVFHLAATGDDGAAEGEVIRGNVGAYESLLTGCVQMGMPLIYASSAAVYGVPPQAGQRKPYPLDAAGRPRSALGAAKWVMEGLQSRISGRTALGAPHVVGLRFFDVFGPGEGRKGSRASIVRGLAGAMLERKPPRLPSDPSVSRDLIYVDDAVAATLAGLGIGTSVRPRPGVYNVGSGVSTSYAQVLAVLRDELGLTESALPTKTEGEAPGPEFVQADLSATLSGLGWKPAWNPIEAIRAYARWMKDRPTP